MSAHSAACVHTMSVSRRVLVPITKTIVNEGSERISETLGETRKPKNTKEKWVDTLSIFIQSVTMCVDKSGSNQRQCCFTIFHQL